MRGPLDKNIRLYICTNHLKEHLEMISLITSSRPKSFQTSWTLFDPTSTISASLSQTSHKPIKTSPNLLCTLLTSCSYFSKLSTGKYILRNDWKLAKISEVVKLVGMCVASKQIVVSGLVWGWRAAGLEWISVELLAVCAPSPGISVQSAAHLPSTVCSALWRGARWLPANRKSFCISQLSNCLPQKAWIIQPLGAVLYYLHIIDTSCKTFHATLAKKHKRGEAAGTEEVVAERNKLKLSSSPLPEAHRKRFYLLWIGAPQSCHV